MAELFVERYHDALSIAKRKAILKEAVETFAGVAEAFGDTAELYKLSKAVNIKEELIEYFKAVLNKAISVSTIGNTYKVMQVFNIKKEELGVDDNLIRKCLSDQGILASGGLLDFYNAHSLIGEKDNAAKYLKLLTALNEILEKGVERGSLEEIVAVLKKNSSMKSVIYHDLLYILAVPRICVCLKTKKDIKEDARKAKNAEDITEALKENQINLI